jgi:hypothetical protein
MLEVLLTTLLLGAQAGNIQQCVGKAAAFVDGRCKSLLVRRGMTPTEVHTLLGEPDLNCPMELVYFGPRPNFDIKGMWLYHNSAVRVVWQTDTEWWWAIPGSSNGAIAGTPRSARVVGVSHLSPWITYSYWDPRSRWY